MGLLESWATKIATEIAPNEVDLAPAMTAAFLAGGEAREQLYMQSKGGGLGGFGSGGIQAIFPAVLSSISSAGSAIMTILCSPEVGTILTVIKTAMEITKLSERQKKVSEELPEQIYRSFKQTVDAFSAGLKSTGYSQDQIDMMTGRFVVLLLENPSSAQEFIQRFNIAPNSRMQPKPKHK